MVEKIIMFKKLFKCPVCGETFIPKEFFFQESIRMTKCPECKTSGVAV